jgi:hypothetical protein
MDEISLLVAETYKHFQENYQPEVRPLIEGSEYVEIPDGPGW